MRFGHFFQLDNFSKNLGTEDCWDLRYRTHCPNCAGNVKEGEIVVMERVLSSSTSRSCAARAGILMIYTPLHLLKLCLGPDCGFLEPATQDKNDGLSKPGP